MTKPADSVAAAFGLARGDVVVGIHCGSRGLGHRIGTEFLREMALTAPAHGITLLDFEPACAPIRSDIGHRYLGALRAGINCALANRQILTHLARRVFAHFFPESLLPVLFDVPLNTCKKAEHEIPTGRTRGLKVHGAPSSVRPPQGCHTRFWCTSGSAGRLCCHRPAGFDRR
jgi:tRNA-splicing ligase RtcB (3'-phosphate/5'-hydroxy nucleic acid ligase)